MRPQLPRSPKSAQNLLRLGLVPVAICALVISATSAPRPASAAPISDLQAQAQSLAQQVNATNARISALAEQYNGAIYRQGLLRVKIAATQKSITDDQASVTQNELLLRQAAINAYVNDGASTASSTIFSANDNQAVTTQLYHRVAANTVADAVAGLTTAVDQLNAKKASLKQQVASVEAQASAAASAKRQADQLSGQLSSKLASVKGALAQALAAQQAAIAAAQARAAQQAIHNAQSGGGSSGGTPQVPIIPPPSTGHGSEVASAAERYLGVPYVWGGSSPSGMDCSGLVILAYAAIGISLPHFSGAQFAMSTPVPISDLQPGDLLFYGPGGSEHVSIYLGGGMMVEAPHTGAVVWNAPVRFGWDFVGAGRI